MAEEKYNLGIDLGSVSLNVVVTGKAQEIVSSTYVRTQGRPLAVLADALNCLRDRFGSFNGVVVTGSGRKLLADVLGVTDVNEIVTQTEAACYFCPQVRTIIEIGGQDSKLVFVAQDPATRKLAMSDHVLNEVCAAGTGSFLDLQAQRLGISIEELSALAVQSDRPARISGRCSVFAKSDMVHLLQEGVSRADISAGLCHALARNFIINLGKGKPLRTPIVFQGGVAANQGVVRAFETLLELGPGGLVIPKHFNVMGAFGAALLSSSLQACELRPLSQLIESLDKAIRADCGLSHKAHLRPLVRRSSETADRAAVEDIGPVLTQTSETEAYLGIDVGAVSTNLVLMETNGRVIEARYIYTQGEPIEAVRSGLEEIAAKLNGQVRVAGVGATGSARYLVGEFVGADVVINEISAQARAACYLVPDADTIIEIGGQDSKYIRCKHGRVVDFEMNRVCAAGTGSFLEEQAARLKIPIKEAFSELAFSAEAPVDLGARCTVFMESDLVHHQQAGKRLNDLAAGLSYAVAYNYLEKVVGQKAMGAKILFQGGVAGNHSVAAAFENILGKPLFVPKYYNVMGALGAALVARDSRPALTQFAGFSLKDRSFTLETFECSRCPNICSIQRINVNGELRSYHGSLCGRYEKVSAKKDNGGQPDRPDLFAERYQKLLGLTASVPQGRGASSKAGLTASSTIGFPRVLTFYDYFPFWRSFFESLGHPLVLSEPTNKSQVEKGLSLIPSETCFPIKAVYGHLEELIAKGVEWILLPCEVDCQVDCQVDCEANGQCGSGGDCCGAPDLRSFNCPYVQSMPYMARAALGSKVKILSPVIRRSLSRKELNPCLLSMAKELGHGDGEVYRAIDSAWKAQDEFDSWRLQRGKEVLDALGLYDQAIVVLGKAHNLFDSGVNLHFAKKLARMDRQIIPYDMLPAGHVQLPDHYDNVVWSNTRTLLKIVCKIRHDPRLFPVLLTNFGCGPDSFFAKYMESELADKACLVLEVDDHTGDAGMVTRIEAFADTLNHASQVSSAIPASLNLLIKGKKRKLDPWHPDPDFMRRLENRVLYFPFVSHAYCSVVEASFKAIGLDARVLPEPDDDSEFLGRQVSSGQECHPFVVTCGEFVKMTRQPGFDPSRAAVLMQNYDGSCRFSQYGIGHAHLFQRLGLPQIPVIAPLTSTRHDEFSGLFGLRLTKLLWQGWLAAEVLERLRLHIRPYELLKGQTDSVFVEGINRVSQAIAKSNGALGGVSDLAGGKVLSALQSGASALKSVPNERPSQQASQRPIIGIVGEFYTVLNSWANHGLVSTLESLGAEVRLHGLTVSNCYSLFSQHYYAQGRLRQKQFVSAAYYALRNKWVMSWVKQAEACLASELDGSGTLDARAIINETKSFINYDIDPILATFTTRVRKLAASGASGICNLFVLNCMLGNVMIPIFARALKARESLPVLHAVYDGQQSTNMLTRIEAFMHQAKLYHERLGQERRRAH